MAEGTGFEPGVAVQLASEWLDARETRNGMIRAST